MKKSFLLIISLSIAIFQLYARQIPSRIEKKNFSDVRGIHFNHSYGNIIVTESTSNQVEIEIQYFDNGEIKPSCDISLANEILEIKTVRPRDSFFKTSMKMGIDYIIAVPKDVAMDVNLKYGNINMGDYYGNFKCDLAYSNFNANTLHNSPVSISSKYSNIKISKVDAINVNCSYGCIDIGSIDVFVADLSHTPANIDYLDKKMHLACSFSNIKIDNSSNDLKEIDFDGSFSNLRLGLAADLSANLNVNLKFSNLSIDDKFEVKYSFSETDYKRTVKKGVIGNETPTANIRISDTYATVKISASSGRLSMRNSDSTINEWDNIHDYIFYAITERMQKNAERVHEDVERMHERMRENAEHVQKNAERMQKDVERVHERMRENAEHVQKNAERMQKDVECMHERMRENAERMQKNVERMREVDDTIKNGSI
ncbi:MAG: hypothetical protein LBF59_04375 [Prevotellaceae bacterium]|jgi:gas vesicle protein|nr:hypothetical protein [Prevotellaceae bacterium]